MVFFAFKALLFTVFCLYAYSSAAVDVLEENLPVTAIRDELPDCSLLPAKDLECDYTCLCTLGTLTNATCQAMVPCSGRSLFKLEFTCQFCYQSPEYYHICSGNSTCIPGSRQMYIANCTVPDTFLCLVYVAIGPRVFQKQVNCSIFTKKSYSTALTLSFLLGGFAADRFYLGDIGWALFKLLSFGGLGVWSIVDLIWLIAGLTVASDGSMFFNPPSNSTLWTYNK